MTQKESVATVTDDITTLATIDRLRDCVSLQGSRASNAEQQLAAAREALSEACDLLAIARLGDSPPLREQADVIRKRGGL